MLDQLPSEWGAQLHVPDEVLVAIDSSLQRERSQNVCYPPAGMELQALELVSPDAVKVVICGQDPYGPGQAHGLAFSVDPGVAHPPSLRNIIKEASEDLGQPWPIERSFDASGCLGHWAREGVLLLNDVLTVQGGRSRVPCPTALARIHRRSIGYRGTPRPAGGGDALGQTGTGPRKSIHESKAFGAEVTADPVRCPRTVGFSVRGLFSQANEWLVRHGTDLVDWMGQ